MGFSYGSIQVVEHRSTGLVIQEHVNSGSRNVGVRTLGDIEKKAAEE